MKKNYEAASATPVFDGENILNDDIVVASPEQEGSGSITLPEDEFDLL